MREAYLPDASALSRTVIYCPLNGAGIYCRSITDSTITANIIFHLQIPRLPFTVFFVEFVIPQCMINRSVCGNMISYSHKKARTFFPDIHTPDDFLFNVISRSVKQNTRIRIPHKAMRPAVFVCYILHIGKRFQHKAIEPTIGNIVNKFGIIAIRGIKHLFPALQYRPDWSENSDLMEWLSEL